jgi:predicted lipoprotein with Yx(FWY)xxD motif
MSNTKRLALYLVSGAAISAVAITAGVAASSPSGAGSAAPAGVSHLITTGSTGAGPILVDDSGRTVYLFAMDTGSMPTCDGPCATYWPPVPAPEQADTQAGVDSASLGSIAAPGVGRQLTYAGHPLYYFAGDKDPGDTSGQGLDDFGAKWYVVSPTGTAVTAPITSSTPKTGSAPMTGYGY